MRYVPTPTTPHPESRLNPCPNDTGTHRHSVACDRAHEYSVYPTPYQPHPRPNSRLFVMLPFRSSVPYRVRGAYLAVQLSRALRPRKSISRSINAKMARRGSYYKLPFSLSLSHTCYKPPFPLARPYLLALYLVPRTTAFPSYGCTVPRDAYRFCICYCPLACN